MIRIGQRLRAERTKKGLTLEDVTKATKIRPSFLQAIEKGEYKKLPASSYAQGFVTNYAEFLGFPKKEALALFRREFDETKEFTVLPERFASPADTLLPRVKIHQTAFAISIAFLVLLAYLGFSYKDAFINPSLSLESPKEEVVKSGDVLVRGETNPYATVTINNAPVSLESDGSFSKRISLFPGRTTIIIKSKNRFGRETVLTRTVEVKE